MEKMEKGFYKVGGCVRDMMLNKTPKDIDYVAVGYTAKELLSLGFTVNGAEFPVYLHPETKDEYALPRRERSTGQGYHDFEVITENVTLKEDLYRRDLTINAMAFDLNGELYDPYNGMEDLKNKVLRNTSEAFFEDPVRVLRLARFSARFPEFTIAKETIEMIKSMKSALANMTKERIWKETEKALSEDVPQKYFRSLLEMEVLDILFPELYEMIGVEQNLKYHAEGDVFEHTMLVLKETSKISKDTITRYAALFHDIGKPAVSKKYGKLHGHDEEELVTNLLTNVKVRYKVPNKYHDLAVAVAALHHRMYLFNQMTEKAIVKTFEKKLFPKTEEDLERFLDAINGDTFGRVIGPGKLLSQEDVELISGERVLSLIKAKELFLPGHRIRKDLVDRKLVVDLFKRFKKVSAKGFIDSYIKEKDKSPAVDLIKAFILSEKVKIVKELKVKPN
jgi:tRNA nucleotidyltransferase (CCA-adding enzyme)